MNDALFFVAWLVSTVISLVILYYIVKAAVRNGVKEGTTQIQYKVEDIRNFLVGYPEDDEPAAEEAPSMLQRRWDERQARHRDR